jgi:quercetin dioxygenase-like cupin family protein
MKSSFQTAAEHSRRFLLGDHAFGGTPMSFRATIAVSALFASIISATAFADGYTGNIQVRTLLKTDTTSLGQVIDWEAIEHPEVTAIEVVIPPGGETGWHRHPVHGYAYVLEGELTLVTETGETLVFGPGRAFAEMVDVRHNGKNLGDIPVRLVAFFTGEKGLQITVRE